MCLFESLFFIYLFSFRSLFEPSPYLFSSEFFIRFALIFFPRRILCESHGSAARLVTHSKRPCASLLNTHEFRDRFRQLSIFHSESQSLLSIENANSRCFRIFFFFLDCFNCYYVINFYNFFFHYFLLFNICFLAFSSRPAYIPYKKIHTGFL